MSKRFRIENAGQIVAHLIVSGLDPNAKLAPPTASLNLGCGDPDCCPQHPGVDHDGTPMVSINTNISGTKLHQIAVELGLVK